MEQKPLTVSVRIKTQIDSADIGKQFPLLFKKILVLIMAAFILFTISGCTSETKIDALSWFLADVDGDSSQELLCITGHTKEMQTEDGEAYGTTLKIYKNYAVKKETVYQTASAYASIDLARLMPMYVQAGDIDGDGIDEIALCVYKSTRFYPEMEKRPFFYRLSSELTLDKVWLGSRLTRPFNDYTLCDVDADGMTELVSIERMQNGNNIIAIYDGILFGFEPKAVSDEWEDGLEFNFSRHRITEQIEVLSKNKAYTVIWEDEIKVKGEESDE